MSEENVKKMLSKCAETLAARGVGLPPLPGNEPVAFNEAVLDSIPLYLFCDLMGLAENTISFLEDYEIANFHGGKEYSERFRAVLTAIKNQINKGEDEN